MNTNRLISGAIEYLQRAHALTHKETEFLSEMFKIAFLEGKKAGQEESLKLMEVMRK